MPPRPIIDSDALAAFVVFAEHLNFTHAAAALGLSQPALHAKVRRLGESLGLELYSREGRTLALTDHGRALLRFGREADSRARDFLSERHGQGERAPVVLAAGQGSYLYLLGEAIQRYLRRARTSRRPPLRLLTRNGEGTLEALRTGEASLGVAVLDAPPTDLEATSICEVPQVLAMPSRHPLARKRKLKLAHLADLPLIVAPAGRPHRETLARALRDAGVPWRVAVETHGWPAMIHFVRLGVGLAVVNGTVKLPRGCVARPIPALPSTRYWLLQPPRITDAARELAESIVRVRAN